MAIEAEMSPEQEAACIEVESKLIAALTKHGIVPDALTICASLLLIAHIYPDEAQDKGKGRSIFISTCVITYRECHELEDSRSKA